MQLMADYLNRKGSNSGPSNIVDCFGGKSGAIGAPPGNVNYTNLKCFDAVGTNTASCNKTVMGFRKITDTFAWCLAGPPYINLLGCCATCAYKINESEEN